MMVNPSKFKKLSKILRIVMNVFFWVSIVGGIISVLAGIVIPFLPNDIFKLPKTGSTSISLTFNGIISYKVDPALYQPSTIKPVVFSIIPMAVIGSFMLSVISRQLGKILKTVELECPFDEKNSKRLTTIGIVIIIASVVFNAAQAFAAIAIIETFQVKNLDVRFSCDGAMMFTGFLVLLLAGVFKYGSYLQQEYDTTL